MKTIIGCFYYVTYIVNGTMERDKIKHMIKLSIDNIKRILLYWISCLFLLPGPFFQCLSKSLMFAKYLGSHPISQFLGPVLR
jgi:hypothetical protein